MRILGVNYEYPPIGGGGGFVTRDIFEEIVSLGHQATIVTSHFEGYKKRENIGGVDILRVPVLLRKKAQVASHVSMLTYFPMSVLETLRNFPLDGFDVINTHFAIPSGPSGHILSKLYRIPNVLSVHGGDIYDPSKALSPHKTPLLWETVYSMLNQADRVVAQSQDTKANTYKFYGINRSVDIIPLGIKNPLFQKKTRRDFALDPDETVFATIGRLVARKNIRETLAILAELKQHLKFTFLIIGEGTQRPSLETIARHFDLGNRVRFAGNVSDETKFQLLDLADCYISTALHEGFGLVFLEAMACGLPVICYNRGGQTDFLSDGETGFIVELGDKKSFAQKVLQISNDSVLRQSIGSHNKKLVKQYFIRECAEKYISLFEESISDYRSSLSR